MTGARFPLIAFNVNLQTADISIARRIADTVRYAKGGYRKDTVLRRECFPGKSHNLPGLFLP